MRHAFIPPALVLPALFANLLVAQDWRPGYPVTEPGARTGTRMVFDAARNEIVLFGGQIVPSPPNNETWTWNGTNWTQKAPAAAPLGRVYHAMCYDSLRQVVVLYGGQSGPSPLNDTWEWNGTTWTQATPAAVPPLRYWPTVAFNGTRTVLFGGQTAVGGAPRNDTWVWGGASWTQLSPANVPPVRYYHSMASNGAGEVLMFGGFDPNGAGYLGDTWLFNGTTWTQVPGPGPQARGRAALVWDAANSRYLLFSGTNSFFTSFEDTWAFASGGWTQLSTQRSPSSRAAGGEAWFPPQNRFVIYSANYLANGDLKSTPMWEFGVNLASFIRFGPSVCPFPDPPVLRGYQSQPALGTTFEARVESVSSVITGVILGLSDTTWGGGSLPFDLVAVGTNPNCLLRVSPDVLLTLGYGQSLPWFLPVPSSAVFLGYTMYAQGFTWGLGTFPTNISLSNAATLVVGAN
jgi:hypothetical protein